MNDVDFPVSKVLDAIEAAADAGLAPVKVDMVVKRGVNEPAIVDMARHFRGTGHILRFIEFMDVGTTNGWRMDDVVPPREIVATINAELADRAGRAELRGEVAERYRYLRRQRRDRHHRLGHAALLRRLHPRPALGGRRALHLPVRRRGHDLRALLRSGTTDEEIEHADRAPSGAPRTTATRRSAPRRPRRCGRSRCRTSAARQSARDAATAIAACV